MHQNKLKQRGNIGIIIILLILLAGGVYFLNLRNKGAPQASTKSNIPSSSAGIATESIEDWHAYINNKYGYNFGFKYPSYFKLLEEVDTAREGDLVISLLPYRGEIFKNQGDYSFDLPKTYLGLRIQLTKSDATLDEFVNDPEVVRFYAGTNREIITLGGQKAYQYINPPSEETMRSHTAKVKNKSFIYSVEMSSTSNKILAENRQLFDQIISTFRFIE